MAKYFLILCFHTNVKHSIFQLCFKFVSLFSLEVGYGSAAGCGIFITSFLGVMVFRKCVGDETMILIGMLSFAVGIYVMSFVTTTSLFYVGETERVG